MLSKDLFEKFRNGGTILCLGAHSDDIEIGCGGTLLKFIEKVSGPNLRVDWIVFSAKAQRAQEALRSAEAILGDAVTREVTIKEFRNGFFPFVGAEIKEFFESLKQRPNPDLILTHFLHDRHQDHRVIAELTWNTFRSHEVLEYEIVKYDADLGSPNAFVTLSREILDRKLDILERCFVSQQDKQWFTRDTFSSIARIRGIECNSESGFAEAFHARKLRLG